MCASNTLYLWYWLFLVFNFIGHFILSEKGAKSIGWASNGFQKEIGLISLGIGVSGIYSGLVDYGFQSMPIVIVLAFFLNGAGINHIREIVFSKNFNSVIQLLFCPIF